MAMLATMTEIAMTRKSRLYDSKSTVKQANRTVRLPVLLYFPPETKGFKTPFRSHVYRSIFEESNRIARSEIESFDMSVWSHPGEEDSWTLCMTVFLNSGWDSVRTVRNALLDYVSALSQDWTDAQREDYQKRIYFEVLPSHP